MNLPQDQSFRRLTTPEIYKAYKEFIATGKYPYLDAVTDFVASKYSIEDTEQLKHELYIASSMFRLEQMVNLENELKDLGFTPITEFEFKQGQKIILQGVDRPLRVTKDGSGDWFSFPPRHTRSGYNLTARIYEHAAYNKAKTEGQLGMRGEKVVMVREA